MNKIVKFITGGVIATFVALTFALPSNLNSTELSAICTPNQPCEISSNKNEITNNAPFSTGDSNQIKLNMAQIRSFINNSTIKTKEFFIEGNWNPQNYIEYFYNYGCIETANTASLNTQNTSTGGGYKNIYNYGFISGYVWLSSNESGVTNIINYGEMGGVSGNTDKQDKTIIIDNRGVINLFQQNDSGKKIHFKQLGTLMLKNYTIRISESANAFNNFDGNAKDNSHLVLDSVTSVRFADKNSKLILDFGNSFEFGTGYLFSKLVVDTSGKTALNVDFDRLTPKNDIYTLYKQGDYFIAKLAPEHSAIANINKSNIRTMNNFYLMSNAMIYPRKSYHSQNLGKKNQNNLVILRERRDRRISKSNVIDSSPKAQNDNIMLVSAIPLKSYESFAYRSESVNRRIQRQNKRNYSRESLKTQKLQNLKQPQNLTADSANRTRESQNLPQNPQNYYFILTPFINHNHFFESGRYNLSGFDYGFLTAFSARVAESNSLGAHFMMSYGSLGDKKDKDFMIKSLNLNVGLNYKLDLMWDMFIKARGDFYYFLNQAKTLTMFEAIKPNNLGFGVSVSYGKEWDFKSGGVLGIEAGIDYKALQSSTISLHDNIYQKALYHLLYADLGVSYNKYFGNFGLNATLGIRGNITANKLAKSQIRISALDRSVDMVLDNDIFLGYANLGASYALNHKDFDMEFSLAYYGNFGDRVISNAGGVEWRVLW